MKHAGIFCSIIASKIFADCGAGWDMERDCLLELFMASNYASVSGVVPEKTLCMDVRCGACEETLWKFSGQGNLQCEQHVKYSIKARKQLMTSHDTKVLAQSSMLCQSPCEGHFIALVDSAEDEHQVGEPL